MSRIAEIFRELAEIAEQTKNMAIAGTASFENPGFEKLMARHARLTAEGQQLLGGAGGGFQQQVSRTMGKPGE